MIAPPPAPAAVAIGESSVIAQPATKICLTLPFFFLGPQGGARAGPRRPRLVLFRSASPAAHRLLHPPPRVFGVFSFGYLLLRQPDAGAAHRKRSEPFFCCLTSAVPHPRRALLRLLSIAQICCRCSSRDKRCSKSAAHSSPSPPFAPVCCRRNRQVSSYPRRAFLRLPSSVPARCRQSSGDKPISVPRRVPLWPPATAPTRWCGNSGPLQRSSDCSAPSASPSSAPLYCSSLLAALL